MALLVAVVLGFAGLVVGVGGASTLRAAANPPVNSTLPTVSGSPQQGQTLLASTGTWTGDTPISYMFAWQRCNSSGASCSDISGATNQAYVVTSSDLGATLRVVITASNAAGTASAASSPTAVVAPPGSKPAPASQPTPQGAAQVGQTVTIDPGTWSGTAPISFGYQWQRCASDGSCVDIGGATSSSYAIVTADTGYRLRVAVTGTNSVGSTSVDSNLTATVGAAGAKPAPAFQPTPLGSARVGQTLTISPGTWSGTAPISFGYQWQRCTPSGSCSNIGGATSSSYVATTADIGYRLRVVVTGTNSVGSTTIGSNLTASVIANVVAPANTSRPTISVAGTSVGSRLGGSVGTWSGAQPMSFSLRWQRCNRSGNKCKTISGATASTYTLAAADAGSTVRFVVVASNPGGSATATSNRTATVTTLPAGGIRLPNGKLSIPVTSVSLPDRLVISGVRFSPSPVRSRASFQARFRITDTRGYVVRGALVYALGLPYSWVTRSAEVATDTNGYAYVDIHPSRKLPLAKGRALVVFVRARKPGESILAGVSTRRLTQVRLAAP